MRGGVRNTAGIHPTHYETFPGTIPITPTHTCSTWLDEGLSVHIYNSAFICINTWIVSVSQACDLTNYF